MNDLDKMSAAELEQLVATANKLIKRRRAEEVEQAKREILEVAERVGVPVAELIGFFKSHTPQRRAGKPVEIKFRHPDDRTWTGRGRQPKWVKEWEEKHGNLDGLRA